VRLASERPDLEFYHLTIAPDLFIPRNAVTVLQENEQTLVVRTQGRAWFSGEFGERLLLGWFGSSRQDFPRGLVNPHPAAGPLPFAVEVLEADAEGIYALRFRFERPLADSSCKFFVSSAAGTTDLLEFALGHSVFDRETGRNSTPVPENIRNLRRMQSAYDRVMGVLLSLR
jgi:hypothetical protein